MINVALIGAGQLGSRHLQGLAKSMKQLKIYVVDPNEESLIVAKNRYEEVSKLTSSKVSYLQSIRMIPENIDLAIIATTANLRRVVVEKLLKQCHLKYLILEKVVFQKTEDFAFIQKLLNSSGVKSWINCVRRAYPIYKKLKEKTLGEKISIKVEGNNWGLACNGIHMIDLLVFLTEKADVEINANELENIIIDSKRKKFIELKGRLKVQTSRGDTLELNDKVKYDDTFRISISNNSVQYNIYEDIGKCIIDNEKDEDHIRIPLQSELTGGIVDQILNTGESDLTSYNECMKYHIPMLDALNIHISKVKGQTVTICPIT